MKPMFLLALCIGLTLSQHPQKLSREDIVVAQKSDSQEQQPQKAQPRQGMAYREDDHQHKKPAFSEDQDRQNSQEGAKSPFPTNDQMRRNDRVREGKPWEKNHERRRHQKYEQKDRTPERQGEEEEFRHHHRAPIGAIILWVLVGLASLSLCVCCCHKRKNRKDCRMQHLRNNPEKLQQKIMKMREKLGQLEAMQAQNQAQNQSGQQIYNHVPVPVYYQQQPQMHIQDERIRPRFANEGSIPQGRPISEPYEIYQGYRQ